MPEGGEGALEQVCRPDVLLVFDREVVERQQVIEIFGQAFHRAVGFHAIGIGIGLRLGHPYIFQISLGFGLDRLGHGVQDIGGLVNPATLNAGFAMDLIQGVPETHGAVTHGQLGCGLQTAAFQVQQQRASALGAFSKAVDQAQNILVAPFVRPDNHQHTFATPVHTYVVKTARKHRGQDVVAHYIGRFWPGHEPGTEPATPARARG